MEQMLNDVTMKIKKTVFLNQIISCQQKNANAKVV